MTSWVLSSWFWFSWIYLMLVMWWWRVQSNCQISGEEMKLCMHGVNSFNSIYLFIHHVGLISAHSSRIITSIYDNIWESGLPRLFNLNLHTVMDFNSVRACAHQIRWVKFSNRYRERPEVKCFVFKIKQSSGHISVYNVLHLNIQVVVMLNKEILTFKRLDLQIFDLLMNWAT